MKAILSPSRPYKCRSKNVPKHLGHTFCYPFIGFIAASLHSRTHDASEPSRQPFSNDYFEHIKFFVCSEYGASKQKALSHCRGGDRICRPRAAAGMTYGGNYTSALKLAEVYTVCLWGRTSRAKYDIYISKPPSSRESFLQS